MSVPASTILQQYRQQARNAGYAVDTYSDEDLLRYLGDDLRAKGVSMSQMEQSYGGDFTNSYYNIINAPEPGREGLLGGLKEYGAGFKKSAQGLLSSGTALGGMAADYAGFERAGEALMDKSAEFRARAAEGAPMSIESVADVRWDNINDVARYLAGGMGQATPSVIEAAGSFALGGGAGAVIAKRAAKKRLAESIAKTNKDNLSELFESAVNYSSAGRRGAQTGSNIALAGSSFGMNTGEIYSELHSYTKLDPSDPDYVSEQDAKKYATSFGLLAGSLDFASAGTILNRLLKVGDDVAATYLKRLAQSLPAGVFVEGTTESAQQFIALAAEKYSKNQELKFTDQELTSMLDAGILGALGGTQFSAVSAIQGPKLGTTEEPDTPEQDKTGRPEESRGIEERTEQLEALLAADRKGYVPEEGDVIEVPVFGEGVVQKVRNDNIVEFLDTNGELQEVSLDSVSPKTRTIEAIQATIDDFKQAAEDGDVTAEDRIFDAIQQKYELEEILEEKAQEEVDEDSGEPTDKTYKGAKELGGLTQTQVDDLIEIEEGLKKMASEGLEGDTVYGYNLHNQANLEDKLGSDWIQKFKKYKRKKGNVRNGLLQKAGILNRQGGVAIDIGNGLDDKGRTITRDNLLKEAVLLRKKVDKRNEFIDEKGFEVGDTIYHLTDKKVTGVIESIDRLNGLLKIEGAIEPVEPKRFRKASVVGQDEDTTTTEEIENEALVLGFRSRSKDNSAKHEFATDVEVRLAEARIKQGIKNGKTNEEIVEDLVTHGFLPVSTHTLLEDGRAKEFGRDSFGSHFSSVGGSDARHGVLTGKIIDKLRNGESLASLVRKPKSTQPAKPLNELTEEQIKREIKSKGELLKTLIEAEAAGEQGDSAQVQRLTNRISELNRELSKRNKSTFEPPKGELPPFLVGDINTNIDIDEKLDENSQFDPKDFDGIARNRKVKDGSGNKLLVLIQKTSESGDNAPLGSVRLIEAQQKASGKRDETEKPILKVYNTLKKRGVKWQMLRGKTARSGEALEGYQIVGTFKATKQLGDVSKDPIDVYFESIEEFSKTQVYKNSTALKEYTSARDKQDGVYKEALAANQWIEENSKKVVTAYKKSLKKLKVNTNDAGQIILGNGATLNIFAPAGNNFKETLTSELGGYTAEQADGVLEAFSPNMQTYRQASLSRNALFNKTFRFNNEQYNVLNILERAADPNDELNMDSPIAKQALKVLEGMTTLTATGGEFFDEKVSSTSLYGGGTAAFTPKSSLRNIDALLVSYNSFRDVITWVSGQITENQKNSQFLIELEKLAGLDLKEPDTDAMLDMGISPNSTEEELINSVNQELEEIAQRIYYHTSVKGVNMNTIFRSERGEFIEEAREDQGASGVLANPYKKIIYSENPIKIKIGRKVVNKPWKTVKEKQEVLSRIYKKIGEDGYGSLSKEDKRVVQGKMVPQAQLPPERLQQVTDLIKSHLARYYNEFAQLSERIEGGPAPTIAKARNIVRNRLGLQKLAERKIKQRKKNPDSTIAEALHEDFAKDIDDAMRASGFTNEEITKFLGETEWRIESSEFDKSLKTNQKRALDAELYLSKDRTKRVKKNGEEYANGFINTAAAKHLKAYIDTFWEYIGQNLAEYGISKDDQKKWEQTVERLNAVWIPMEYKFKSFPKQTDTAQVDDSPSGMRRLQLQNQLDNNQKRIAFLKKRLSEIGQQSADRQKQRQAQRDDAQRELSSIQDQNKFLESELEKSPPPPKITETEIKPVYKYVNEEMLLLSEYAQHIREYFTEEYNHVLPYVSTESYSTQFQEIGGAIKEEEYIDDQFVDKLDKRVPYRNLYSPVTGDVENGAPLVVDEQSAKAADAFARKKLARSTRMGENPLVAQGLQKELADNRLAIAEFIQNGDSTKPFSIRGMVSRALDIINENPNFRDGEALGHLARKVAASKLLDGVDLQFIPWEKYSQIASINEAGYSAATYIPGQNIIYVSDVFGDIDGTPMENLVSSIIHEAIHVPTKMFLDVGYAYYKNQDRLIDSLPDTTAGPEMGEMFGKLNDVLLPILRSKAKVDNFYALSSVDELLSEVGSNAEFRQFLRNVNFTAEDRKRLGIQKSAIRTAFDWIVDMLSKLLGIGSNPKPEVLDYTQNQLKKVISLADGLSMMGHVIHNQNVRGINRLDIFGSRRAKNFSQKRPETFTWIDGSERFHITDRSSDVTVFADESGQFRALRERLQFEVGGLSEPNGEPVKLGKILQHPDLYSAYPELAEVDVQLIKGMRDGANWNKDKNRIRLGPQAGYIGLIHEIQHAVDAIEGYDEGANVYYSGRLINSVLKDLGLPLPDLKNFPKGVDVGNKEFAAWRRKSSQRLSDLALQVEFLAEDTLEVAPRIKNVTEDTSAMHTLFQIKRMLETFSELVKKAELPKSLVEQPTVDSLLIPHGDEGRSRTLGETIYRYNFGEITASVQEKLLATGTSEQSEVGEAGVGRIMGVNFSKEGAQMIASPTGKGKSKFDQLVSQKMFGNSWGLPTTKTLKMLKDALVPSKITNPLRSFVNNVLEYNESMNQHGSQSFSRPRPDDGARIYHEAQSIGINELVAGLVQAYREVQDSLPADMDLSGFIDSYGKLELDWGKKKVSEAIKAQDKLLAPFGVKSGTVRLGDTGRNSVAKNYGKRAATAFIEASRLNARTEASLLFDKIEQAKDKEKEIAILFKSLEDNRLSANEDLVNAFRQKLLNTSIERLEKYLDYLPNEIINQDDLNMLQKISDSDILVALEAIINADGAVENLPEAEMNDALRGFNLSWFSGGSTQSALARVAMMETVKNSRDIISLMRMSRNKLQDDQVEFFEAVKDMLAQKTVEGVESVALKAPQRVATKFKQLKQARIQQLELKEILPAYENDLKVYRAVDEVLKVTSDRFRFNLGELENFDIRDGVKIKAIMQNEKGEDYVGEYEVKFKNGELDNRKEFIKVNRKTLEFLRFNKEQYEIEPWYDLMREQAEAALALPITQQWSAVRRSAWMAGLESVNQRFSRLGYEGKKLAGMTARTVAIYRDLISKGQFHAKEFNRAYENAIKALDVDGQTFYTGMYQDIFWWFDNHPEHANREEEAFTAMWKEVRKKANVPDKSKLNESSRQAVRTLVQKVIAARDYEAKVNRDLGNRIKDDEFKVQSYLDGDKMVDFYRLPLDMGYATIPRAVNDAKVISLVQYMSSEDRGSYVWDGMRSQMPVDEMIRALHSQGQTEEIAKELDNLFSDEVVVRFLEPFVTAGSRKSQFYGPQDQEGWGAELSNEFVASQWERSGKKLIPFLDRLFQKLADPQDLGNSDKLGDWYLSFYKQIHKRYRDLHSTARDINSKAEGETRETEAMKHTPRSLDARQVESKLPKDFFLYDMYDETSNSIRMAMFAGASVFGRDGSKATEAFAQGRKSLKKSFELFRSVIATVTGHKPDKPEGGYSKAVKNLAYAELRKLGFNNPAAKFKQIYNDSVAYGELRTVFQHLRKYYGSNNEAGPYKDARFLLELLGTQSLAVLNNPKSSFWQGMSMFEFPLAFRGANKMAAKGTAKALSNFVNQTFGGMAEAMGMQLDRVGSHAANLNSTHFRIEEMELALRDYITQVGNGGELTDKTNPKRYLRILQDISTHHKARGTRAPVDLMSLVTGIFPYVNNVVNHSVGVGAMYVYQDLVLKVAKHIENNGLSDSEFSEVTAEQLGLGQSSVEWIVGEKDGYQNANNMLVEAGAPSITRMAYDYIDRKASNPSAEVIPYNTGLLINQLAMNNISGEGFNSKPAWLYTNPIMKYFAFFLGWPLGKVARDNRFIFRGDKDSVNSYAAFIKYLGLMSAIYLPVGLSFAFMIDWYDEEVLNKPNNLPPLTPWAALPFVGPAVAMNDPNFSIYAVTSRMAKAGTPYGMGFDLMNSIMAKGDPYSAAREFSLDSRIFAFSMIKNIYDAMGNWMHQGEWDWANVGRPLTYAMGGNSVIQMMDATNQLLDLDTEEARVAEYIGVRNYIKATAYLMDMELRPPGKGYSRPSPISINIRQMERAAYAGDERAFAKEYAEAIEAAREEILRTGRAETAEQLVRSRFQQRSLRTGVTRGKIMDSDWNAMLNIMPADMREKILRYESNHQYFLNEISVANENPYSINELRAMMAAGVLP